ncbi:histidine kinase [Methylobacillus caricis]|uniref:histidine kinase n=1 Tax=Methylobacillus caricis TaxID=1971611 RepID=UPI001CFF938F|nr:histidine kinase [Methylobacillus caricis]MCB5186546.1 histidine kinase [Methylobacillus caricis]
MLAIKKIYAGLRQRGVLLAERVLRHTLYLRLTMLLSCVAILSVMMQVGSFFLLDYIPASQSAIQDISQRKLEWSLVFSNSSLGKQPSKWNASDLAGGQALYGWYADHQAGKLATLVATLNNDEQAFRALQGQVSTETYHLSQKILDDHDEVIQALRRDVEEKQTVLAMLQLMGLVLLLFCLASAAYMAKQVLIDRVANLVALLPAGEEGRQQDRRNMDEFSLLESMVHELAAQSQGFKAETEWFNRTKSELLRRLLRARTFVHGLVLSLQDSQLNESAIRTIIYSMESSLDLRNVAIRFVLGGLDSQGEKMLFSQYAPELFPDAILRDLATQRSAKFNLSSGAECIVASFTCPGDSFGLLILEAKLEQEFYESDVTLAEITAQLLSMVMGAQSREEQARRLALFEERAAIARELHDSLAQSLSFMKIQIARLQTHKELQRGETNEITSELREGLDNAYRELRELLSTFRMHMDVRGLGFAIQSAIDEFSHRSAVAITLDNRLVNCRLTVNEEFHMLHVIREALSNIIRHAGAQNVVVALAYTQGSTVVVTIDDDGIGMAGATDEHGHYGQSIMRDRAYSLGGEIAVTSRRKGGTRVRLVFTPKLMQ